MQADVVVAPFITHLWEMLGEPEHTPYIAWTTSQKDGEAVSNIKIVDPEGFAKVVVPKYFNHRNIPSFVRQLNLYGFKKTSQGPDVLEFSHPSFQLGHPENLSGCVRKRKKVRKKNAAAGSAGSGQSRKRAKIGGRTTRPADLASQREDLDVILRDMAAMQRQQAELSASVAQLQEQNAELRLANASLHKKAVKSLQVQDNMNSRLNRTFHFMLRLWEQMQKEGGILRVADGQDGRLPFNAVHANPRLKNRSQDFGGNGDEEVIVAEAASSSSAAANVASSSSSSAIQPTAVGVPIGDARPLRRLTSRDSALFSNPGSERTIGYDDLESTLGVLGYVDSVRDGSVSVSDRSDLKPSRPLSRGISRQSSFVSNPMRDHSFSFSEQELDNMRESQEVSLVGVLVLAVSWLSFLDLFLLKFFLCQSPAYANTQNGCNLGIHTHVCKILLQDLDARLDKLQRGLSRQLSGSASFEELLTKVNLFPGQEPNNKR